MNRNAVRRILLTVCVILMVEAFGASSATAISASASDLEARLELMQNEIERLRDENKAFRSEIDELRAATEDDWLTEQRAEEIRGIVYDVLADAETRSNLIGDGLMAGWRDGFFLASADGRFMLRIFGQTQVRFLYNFHDQRPPSPFVQPAQVLEGRHKRGFETTRVRFGFTGHLFTPDLTFFVRGNFQRDNQVVPQRGGYFLEDAWIRYHLNNEFSIRVGQFKLPFSREFLVSSAHQLAVERSVIDNELNIGRSQGIELVYATDQSRFSGVFSDGGVDNLAGDLQIAALHNPRSSAALRTGAEYAWTVRYEHLLAGTWEQFQDITSPMHDEFGVMLGIAGHMQRTEATGIPPLPTPSGSRAIFWYAYTIDASIEFGGANLFASFTHHHINQPERHINIFGVVVQGGMYFTPKIEGFARYEFGKWSFDAPPGNEDFIEPLHMLTTGFNYYLDGHDVKWTTDIGVAFTQVGRGWARSPAGITGWRSENPDAKPQIVFRTQFQILF